MRQSQKGTIAFYSRTGQFLYERSYRDIAERREIIGFARAIYGKVFLDMYYHIKPKLKERSLEKLTLPEPIAKAA